MASAISGNRAWALWCRGENIETMYLIVNEFYKAERAEAINTAKPKMRIRVDEGPDIEIGVTLKMNADWITVSAGIEMSVLDVVRNAKNRV
ncbi:hypothetical protein [Ensifer sp. B1-9]|uniref:hypothetical protein n=1 Tax=Ensifer sp. B1-9 TaxID=3141455 RepID=UPI003D25E86E